MSADQIVVLLAEDEPAHREAIRRNLAATGARFEVRTANSLGEYLEMAAADPPDIAMVDLNLPDGRAVEVLTSPAESGPFPVLVMTSYGNEQTAVEALKSGALDYLVKSPEAFADMPRIIERSLREWKLLLERKRAEEQLRKAHDELEVQVRERTEELAKTITLLQEEMSERLHAMEALRQQERLLILQSRFAAMGEMIGNIAHQWRQPINGLGLIVQDMALTYDLGGFNRDFLADRVDKATELISHMSRTIDDFRDFFKQDKKIVPFNVRELIEKSVSLVEASFRSQDISIEVHAPGNPVINGYPGEYSQVLLNILVNARDALLERGTPNPEITVTLCTENGKTAVTIADNAGGIAEDIMDKVFDPYFTTKGPQRGTGIGLFMAKTIIEKNMNGRVTARNAESGAEFRIEV